MQLLELSVVVCFEVIAVVFWVHHGERGLTLGLVLKHLPSDVPIVKSAIAGHADVLCTLDRDIRRDLVASWCSQFGIHILTDVELSHVLRTQVEPDTD